MWIQCHKEHRETMAGFLEMNSHMKSWLNSSILTYSWFSSKFISVWGNVLLIQSNHHSLFAVSLLQALRLLRGCCLVASKRRCCNGKRLVLLTAEQGGRWGPCKQIWTSLALRSAGPACHCQQETFKLRDYQRDQPQGHNPEGAIRSSEGFQAGEGRW